MCGQDPRDGHEPAVDRAQDAGATNDSTQTFPWDLAIFDAHCHPTDTMSSTERIPDMRARLLTIMATRSQDQDLVASVGTSLGLRTGMSISNSSGLDPAQVVPAFGWHPWFSHQLYDDTSNKPTYKPKESASADDHAAANSAHYAAVLQPSRDDPDFIASLPTPVALSHFISSTRKRLLENPLALVGEIGLDKAFRLPQQWQGSEELARDDTVTPGGREGRLLSPYHVAMSHQVKILKAQLALAAELGRAVSVHGVQAHGVLFDVLCSTWKGHEKEILGRRQKRLVSEGAEDFSSDEDDDEINRQESARGTEHGNSPDVKPYPPRICLHSFSGSTQMAKQYINPTIPAEIFFSFSSCINLGTPSQNARSAEVIQAVPENRILVESDLHIAGEEMDAALAEMYRKVCEIRGWSLEDGIKRIGHNFHDYILGRQLRPEAPS
jgi:Tat protein secretion system quality control protein TatD with DNase activity